MAHRPGGAHLACLLWEPSASFGLRSVGPAVFSPCLLPQAGGPCQGVLWEHIPTEFPAPPGPRATEKEAPLPMAEGPERSLFCDVPG